mmetsp:Transcript_1923/g.4899  ORF Transcript_1923/g.4899 Transcript_1923/m.4899 type:complete len:142 (-) Transcript_1923:139-564(-)
MLSKAMPAHFFALACCAMASSPESAIQTRPGELARLEFTVHGRVQRVFFRAYTKRKADALGLVGWCKNTPENTVVGVVEGESTAIEAMRVWLSTTGSPKSRIARLDVNAYSKINRTTFADFSVDDSYGHAPRQPARHANRA